MFAAGQAACPHPTDELTGRTILQKDWHLQLVLGARIRLLHALLLDNKLKVERGEFLPTEGKDLNDVECHSSGRQCVAFFACLTLDFEIINPTYIV